MEYQRFEDLNTYKECRVFRQNVSEVVKKHFPNSEKFQLTSQILNSSRSVTANIAEGYGRFYYQDNIRFCRIARGSLEETLEHLITAKDEDYINSELLKDFRSHHEKCLQLLNGYIRYLRTSKKGKPDSAP